jgi:aspartyl protease family protein
MKESVFMLYIGIALLIAAGGALIVGMGAGEILGLSPGATASLLGLLLILVVIAGGVFRRRQNLSRLAGQAALWAGLFAVALVGYAYRFELETVAMRVMGELTPGAAIVDANAGTASFRRGSGGSFTLETEVNGAPVRMIFDTGATAVVLTFGDAAAAGIETRNLRFSTPVQTANGTGFAAPVILGHIEVGGIVRNRAWAFVAERGALDTSLLGMTFLETLSGYAVNANRLELQD